MKKSYKLIILAVVVVGTILFLYPKSFEHYYKGRFIWQRLKFSEELQGNITIGDKTYSLSPVDLYEFPNEDGNYTDNGIYESLLSFNPEDIVNDKFLTFYVTHDMSKLYIRSDSQEFIYPYNSEEDYQKVKDRMYQ